MDHVHDLDSGKGGAGGFEAVKAHHGFDYFLNEPVVLLYNIVKILCHPVLHVAGEQATEEMLLNRYLCSRILIGRDNSGHGVVASP